MKQTIINKKDYIVESHLRCKKNNIELDRMYSTKIIDDKELFNKLEAKRELILTATPFMNQLYNFVKGSHFFAILTDEEGCILSVIGDEVILSEAFSFNMIPGAYMDENNIGTNAMGTCLMEERPIQVSGEEHFIKVYHRWTCSASPIRNTNGDIIGSLDLTGYSENVHSHTLGMVVAAANAIEKMLEIHRYAKELSMTKLYNEAIIHSIMAGIVTSDLEGNVITVNRYAAEMFGYPIDEMKKKQIQDLVKDWEKIINDTIRNNLIKEKDMMVFANKNKIHFNVTTYPIFDEDSKVRDIIYVFKDIKKERKLARRIAGRHAIYTFDKIIGQDENFMRVIDFAKKIADSRSNVLITGESGTGKELFVQAIHNYSSRCDEPFVALNCGAIPRSLIESELFGYVKGAFTGANSNGQPGKFEIADGGTIFLDEIGEMPIDMQTRLLRVIEEGTVNRVGSVEEKIVSVRVIAATNKDLNEEVSKGNFRKDLFYRLNVLPIRLPPLRERKGDIILLIEYFMRRITKRLNKKNVFIPDDILQDLINYSWPGNVRELENYIELIVNTETTEEINIGNHLKPLARNNIASETEDFADYKINLKLEEVERIHIEKVISHYHGNISTSARILGIGRNTLYRKIQEYHINCSQMKQCSDMEQPNHVTK